MKRLYLLALSLFFLFSLSGCLELLGLDHHMNAEQKKQYEQLRKMGRIVIRNSTSSTAYLVVDYMGYGNIPAGRRAYISVVPGAHTLEAYDRNGRITDRARIYLDESGRYYWTIGK